MRVWMAGLSAALVTSCGNPPAINDAPEPTAAAIEAGLPSPGTATEATKQANAALAARLDLSPGSDGEDARRDRLSFIEDEAIRSEAHRPQTAGTSGDPWRPDPNNHGGWTNNCLQHVSFCKCCCE